MKLFPFMVLQCSLLFILGKKFLASISLEISVLLAFQMHCRKKENCGKNGPKRKKIALLKHFERLFFKMIFITIFVISESIPNNVKIMLAESLMN